MAEEKKTPNTKQLTMTPLQASLLEEKLKARDAAIGNYAEAVALVIGKPYKEANPDFQSKTIVYEES